MRVILCRSNGTVEELQIDELRLVEKPVVVPEPAPPAPAPSPEPSPAPEPAPTPAPEPAPAPPPAEEPPAPAPAPEPAPVPAPPPVEPPAPVPAPAPAPVPVIAKNTFPQYLIEDTGAHGPTRSEWSQELRTRWRSALADINWKLGNWLDANGVSQGTAPYSTLSIGPSTPLGYLTTDVTALVSKWVTTGHNRGAYLRSEASPTFTAYAQVDGRLGANPPKLHVVTTQGEFDIIGMLAGWASTTNGGMNTSATMKLTKGSVGLLRFPLEDVTGDVISATLSLGLTGRHTSAVLTLQVMETDPPYVQLGNEEAEVQYGLAAQVGEANLPSHPDVFQAGDFAPEKWFTLKNSGGCPTSNRSAPPQLGMYNTIPSDIVGYEYEFVTAEDGTKQLRASFVHGDGRTYSTSGPSLRGEYAVADLNDPKLPMVGAIDHMFVRCYLELEDDFWTTTDGIKGGTGFDARGGYWKKINGGYWQHTTGNSGTPGTGKKIMCARSDGLGQVEYQGHSMRMHFDTCKPSGTPYQKYRPILMMVSHNGPYDYTAPYGSEEIRRCGTAVVEKGKMHCVEWELKMNSITGPYDDMGNGVGVRDGVMRLWVDGVMRWEKTDFVFRLHPELGIVGPWIVWVHGGLVPAAVGEIMHYKMADFACARSYIGPKI